MTIPAVGKCPFPGILLITGSGAEDMNETAGFIRIDNRTGEKIAPPVPFFQIADYLSERGFTVLRYDKRGVVDNQTKIFEFQTVGLPILYAKEILDKNHDGKLAVQEASRDVTFERLVGGNLSLILTHNLGNVTKATLTEYNANNDTDIIIDTELKPALVDHARSFFSASKTTSAETAGKCTNLEGCSMY